ncbi:FHA domain-containing protein [Roseovarius sp. MMSF_3281]|uniref:FHA domain-containing protein n=1 Tax=Roseovarius sp. MMSF_3281 TaxID=3046694 RepID=UPI00273DB8C4|nr:FHA domain-containing protein [Roseovarius sp. MMSF_3281]
MNYVIGNQKDADIHLDVPSVSASHASLSIDDEGQTTLSDLGSAEGTFIHLENRWLRITSAPVAAEDRVRLGTHETTVGALLDSTRDKLAASGYLRYSRDPETGEITAYHVAPAAQPLAPVAPAPATKTGLEEGESAPRKKSSLPRQAGYAFLAILVLGGIGYGVYKVAPQWSFSEPHQAVEVAEADSETDVDINPSDAETPDNIDDERVDERDTAEADIDPSTPPRDETIEPAGDERPAPEATDQTDAPSRPSDGTATDDPAVENDAIGTNGRIENENANDTIGDTEAGSSMDVAEGAAPTPEDAEEHVSTESEPGTQNASETSAEALNGEASLEDEESPFVGSDVSEGHTVTGSTERTPEQETSDDGTEALRQATEPAAEDDELNDDTQSDEVPPAEDGLNDVTDSRTQESNSGLGREENNPHDTGEIPQQAASGTSDTGDDPNESEVGTEQANVADTVAGDSESQDIPEPQSETDTNSSDTPAAASDDPTMENGFDVPEQQPDATTNAVGMDGRSSSGTGSNGSTTQPETEAPEDTNVSPSLDASTSNRDQDETTEPQQPQDRCGEATLHWNTISASGNPALLEQHIRLFGDCDTAGRARRALEDLNSQSLVEDIQSKLKEAGCYMAGIDGIWGNQSRQAIANFVTHSGESFDEREPSSEMLIMLGNHEGRVCPLVCDARHTPRNGECVLKTCPSGQRLSQNGNCYSPQSQKEAKCEAYKSSNDRYVRQLIKTMKRLSREKGQALSYEEAQAVARICQRSPQRCGMSAELIRRAKYYSNTCRG